MGAKVRAIIKRPDEKYGHVSNISLRLENLQNIVGGYIETVCLGPNTVLIMNEEGKLLGLEPNMLFCGDMICGNIIVLGVSDEDFDDLEMSFDVWKKLVDQWDNPRR